MRTHVCPSPPLVPSLASSKLPSLPSSDLIAYQAQRCQALLSLHDIRLSFSSISKNGVTVADATRNPTGAYKVRGALSSVASALGEGVRTVVAASAGNHGAGIAFAAKALGGEAVVYVPESAPEIKVRKISHFGAKIVRVGRNFDETLAHAQKDPLVSTGNAKFVHAFNDYTVAAGQGTIGVEIVRHVEPILRSGQFSKARIFLPVGGGGLAAGVASVLKTLWPEDLEKPEIVGVVDESSPAALLGLIFGRPIRAESHTIADGTRVALVGDVLLSVADKVDYLLAVPHDEIVSAMRYYEKQSGEHIEGAGVLGIAGEWVSRRCGLFSGEQKVLSVPLLTGRNVDPDYFEAMVRADPRLQPGRLVRSAFDVAIPEEEGELLKFLQCVRSYNIAGLTYKQREGNLRGRLRVEFEVAPDQVSGLTEVIARAFPGSQPLKEGAQMLYEVGTPVAQRYHESSLALEDRPGEFLRYVEAMARKGEMGQVGFLFYRKPPTADCTARVVIGVN